MSSESNIPAGTDAQAAIGDQRAMRIKKLEELQAAGICPFGTHVEGIVSTESARRQFAVAEAALPPPAPPPPPSPDGAPAPRQDGPKAEVPALLAGRLMSMRLMGKSIFGDLKDESGRIQIYAQKNVLGEESFARFKKLDIGDILSVEGKVFRTHAGEVTLRVEGFVLQAKALRPLPEKWHGLTDVEQRYRQRYVDLIVNDDVRRMFKTRSAVVRAIRNFMGEKGFMEVETPMLQPIPGGAAARPFQTYYNALDCPMYMRIAPELYLKRLLVGGFEKVFEINRNFRNEGLSRRHNPEFTMMEVYEAFGDCRTMMALVEELVTTVAQQVFGTLRITNCDGKEISLERPWRRATYAELVREKMGADWYSFDPATQRQRAEQVLGHHLSAAMTAPEVTHEIYEKAIEPTLIQPTFVTRMPAELVPLAKRCADDPAVVDVFELEINGQEIAPGYSELNDALDQRRRFEAQAARIKGTAEEASGAVDEDFLVALEHGMPPAGGMGIGIDRLLILLTGAASIRDVILFPQLRPEKAVAPAAADPAG